MLPCVSVSKSEDIKRSFCTGVLILGCAGAMLHEQIYKNDEFECLKGNHFINTNVPHHSFTDPKSPFLSVSWSMTVKTPSTLFTALLAGL